VDVRPEWQRLFAAIACAGFAAIGSACFSPKLDRCAISCGEGGVCPTDHICLEDGVCHASRDDELCLPGREDASFADGPIDQPDAGEGQDGSLPDGGEPPIDAAFDAGRPITPTNAGDLVITEIHKDPFAAQDPAGEWFEIFNPTSTTFDLLGLRISDLGAPDVFDIDQSVIIPPGGRAVFARVGDPDTNGGVTVDFTYGKAFALGNDDDEIVVENPDALVIIDSVLYDPKLSFPDLERASASLDPDEHDVLANNDGENWCDGSTVYGAGDLGTPGGPNPQCR
jgi:hypothetical protein